MRELALVAVAETDVMRLYDGLPPLAADVEKVWNKIAQGLEKRARKRAPRVWKKVWKTSAMGLEKERQCVWKTSTQGWKKSTNGLHVLSGLAKDDAQHALGVTVPRSQLFVTVALHAPELRHWRVGGPLGPAV